MRVTDDIKYIGVNDHDIDLFEGQYVVPDGMSYNSYVILDQKIAVMDSVEARFGEEWIQNLEAQLDGRTPDYLVVQHMEPDHSANITTFMERYPQAQVVASAGAFNMMEAYFGTRFEGRGVTIKQGSTLSLGKHELSFVAAPLVHWPEVMFTYDATDRVLFSADAFGKFGALDVQQEWDQEARRYYFGIVGKFGRNVQAVLKKAAKLDIQAICPLHGPVLSKDLPHYLGLYQTWSSYEPEAKGVTIAYASVYGHTKATVEELARALEQRGATVATYDLARDDQAAALADAFRYDTLVLAAPTYNGGVFPAMHGFIDHLLDHNYQNRRVALVENGSWAPAAAKTMAALLEPCKGLEFATTVTVKGSLDDASRTQVDALAKELVAE